MARKGFTLVELIAVITILAFIVLIAQPKYMELTTKAKETAFETNHRTCANAMVLFSASNDGKYPTHSDYDEIKRFVQRDEASGVFIFSVFSDSSDNYFGLNEAPLGSIYSLVDIDDNNNIPILKSEYPLHRNPNRRVFTFNPNVVLKTASNP